MDQIVEMGKTKTSCGVLGCGEVAIEKGPMGTRCRSAVSGSYVPCPAGVSRDAGVGFFLKKDAATGRGNLPWGRLPGADWGIVSTPNLRRPKNPAGKTYHALKRHGLEKYEAKFPGRVETLFSGKDFKSSASTLDAKRRIDYMRQQSLMPGPWSGYGTSGIGRFGGRRVGAYYPPFRVGASFGPFNFDPSRAIALTSPMMVQPHHLVIGNLAGAFVPGAVNYALEKVAMPDLARSALRFGLAASGAFLILFGRQNGYMLGAGLALLPQTITSVMSLGKAVITPKAAQPAADEAVKGLGQWTPSEKAALKKESMRTFGVNVNGPSKRVGFNRGFEVVVPDDFGDLSRGSVQVAKAMSGLGANPFKPLGS